MSVDGDRSGVDGAAWSGRLHTSTLLHEQFGVGWLDEKTGEANCEACLLSGETWARLGEQYLCFACRVCAHCREDCLCPFGME